jgi:hypothetical protein
MEKMKLLSTRRPWVVEMLFASLSDEAYSLGAYADEEIAQAQCALANKRNTDKAITFRIRRIDEKAVASAA